jgi:hypothetical protein
MIAASGFSMAIPIFFFVWVLNNLFGIWVLDQAPITNDAREYFDSAKALWQGAEHGQPHYWPPGGPFVLAGLFSIVGSANESHVQLFMAALSAATTGFVFLLGRDVFLSRGVGIVAASLYGFSPTTIFMSRQSEGHTFCAFWITLAALFAVKYFRSGRLEQLVIVAMSLAMLVLTRPGSALLLSVLIFLPWIRMPFEHTAANRAPRTQAFVHTLLAGVIVSAFIAPVLKFNHDRGAGWVLSTNNERNFFLGNNRYTPIYKTGHLAWRPLEDLPEPTQKYLKELYDAPESRKAMMNAAWSFIRDEPILFVQRSVNRFLNYWTFDYEQGRRLQLHLASRGKVSWLPMVAQAIYSVGLLWLLFTTLPTLLRSDRRAFIFVILASIFMYQLPHIIAFSSPVYRTGMMPLICAITAAGALAWYREYNSGKSNRSETFRAIIKTGVLVALGLLVICIQAAYYLVTTP